MMDENGGRRNRKYFGNARESKQSPDRERYSDETKHTAETSSSTLTKPPIILMKPRRAAAPAEGTKEEDEEWPAVGKFVAVVRSTQQQPMTQSRTGSPALGASGSSVAHHHSLRNSEAAAAEPAYAIRKPISAQSYTASGNANREHTSKSDASAVHQHTTSKFDSSSVKPLRRSIKLVSESMEWCETAQEFLMDQPDYLVIGVLGPQGIGKSTLISMIGGNDPFDMYRQYIFRPASKECTETANHQTQGINFFITDDRVILLDSQPISSPAVMHLLINSDRRYSYDCNTSENYVELESLQIASFLMQVCHVVIVLVDYFIDVNLLNFIKTCEILKPNIPLSENPSGLDHYPHIIFVQNRAKRPDFSVDSINRKCDLIEKAFQDSNLVYSDGVAMKYSSYSCYKTLKDCKANVFVLPDMKPRGYKTETHTAYKGIPDYEVLVRELRNQLVSLPRHSFGPALPTEKSWFHFAARMWDITRKSLLIAEYGRMLP